MTTKQSALVKNTAGLDVESTHHAIRTLLKARKARLRVMANAKVAKQLRSKAKPAGWDRRVSYEIGSNIWDTLSEGTKKIELAERLSIPVEDLQSVRQTGSIVIVTFDIRNSRLHARIKPLYRDVGDDGKPGVLYGTHLPQLDLDPHLGPYWPDEHAKELARAEALSYKPIPDAPAAYTDLPWKELLDPRHMITIEEFLVYFPNHVARWPGLAATLRWTNLDRLFYRAARIINLARGSHESMHREDHHTEVLPLQMKIQRAIRELDPGYNLFDFPHENYSQESIDAHLRKRPRGQSEQQDLVCTLQEAAGYITGINEFEAYSPFSQYMKQFQPQFKRLPPPVMPKHTGRLGSLEAYVTYQAEAGDEFTGWPAQSAIDSAEAARRLNRNQSLLSVCGDSDCDQLECEMVHAETEQQGTWDPSQPIVFASQGAAAGRNRNNNNTQPSSQWCSQGTTCLDQSCTLKHPGPWTDPGVRLHPSNSQARCRHQARCTDAECNKSHGSWAWLYENKGPVGNTNGTNGQVHCAPWQQACTFESRPGGCKNARCGFGHRGPETALETRLEFETRPRCPWDRQCNKRSCCQAHSSPASNGGGGGGNGGQYVGGGQRTRDGQGAGGGQRAGGGQGAGSGQRAGGGRGHGGGPHSNGNTVRGPRNHGNRGRGRGRGIGR